MILIVSLLAAPSFAEVGYLEYTAGLSIVPNQSLSRGDATSAGFSGSIQTNPGYVVGAAVGGQVFEILGAKLRAEVALNYRNSDVDSSNIGGPNISPQQGSDASGDVQLFSAMANGYVDYDFGIKVVPYLGAGIGYGLLKVDTQNRGSNLKINDSTSAFTWNLMAGMTFPYTDTVDFVGGYRYVATDDVKLDSFIVGIGARRLDAEYDAHEVSMGIRIKF